MSDSFDSPAETAPRVRIVGERVEERARARRAAEEKQAKKRREGPSHPAAAPPTRRERGRIAVRILLFALLAVAAYALLRQLTYLVFAPELEFVRPLVPEGGLAAGEPVTLGVVVRNHGSLAGASFVVAVSGDREVEGPTLDVPPRDSALIPVRLRLNSGTNVVSLLVFDGWRGVRQIASVRNLALDVEPRAIEVFLPQRTPRGDDLRVSIPWSNLGVASETVVPVLVFRAEGGGPPVDIEGPRFDIAAGEERTLELAVDTWPLRPGRYSLQVYLEAQGRERVARSSPHTLEVIDP